jgi:hypothetical protein
MPKAFSTEDLEEVKQHLVKDKDMGVKYWYGTVPEKCDICEGKINALFYDAATDRGPWGILCNLCWISYGRGLGTGLGQRYEFNAATKKWEKTGG